MSRIAVFGGSFDPPHIGHMYNIQTVLNSGLVDEVWVVPADDGRYDKPTKASAQHRKKMVELALADFFHGDKRVSLNSIQLDNELKGAYTIDLLDELERRYPTNQFFFVIGTENVSQIPTWKSAEKLMAEKKFLAVRRPGADGVSTLPTYTSIVGNGAEQSLSISSTEIRRLIKAGVPVDKFISPAVQRYVEKFVMYR